ncbi:sel1 repeat family protein [Pelagibius litoralis]|uniref:Sel1 repeat family protein n=1 Tax=Pelagibius litoralis TaxID=374515 RepID=A0A967F0I4_9PROT|nr:tetratricopeptide repeat protein [Pelagibius litoralis]NIA70759.1 sel1 repeat family protein [Pelagibius litoralis]
MISSHYPRRGLKSIAVLASLSLTIAACTEVKDTLDGANEGMSGALGDDGTPAASGEQNALVDSAVLDALYDEGLNLRQTGSEEEAFLRFQEAAERGHGPAAFELGEAYNEGRGVEQDLNAGAKWINAAAGRGEPRAQYLVGAAYYAGDDVEQDFVRAVSYLDDAAGQGHAPAQFLLAECYANGRGVTKNLSWAARWYGKAAEQGHADGAFSYGVVQAAGLGLPTNLPRGYAWLSVADGLGHATAKDIRAAIANNMSPAELERGKARAAAFKPQSETTFADKPTIMFVQHSLNQLGFNAGTVDGLSGPRTRGAIGAYLKSVGDESEAAITPELLQRLLEGQQNTA